MNKPRKPFFTEHRRKRLTLWALTVLGWLMSVLFGDREVSVRENYADPWTAGVPAGSRRQLLTLTRFR